MKYLPYLCTRKRGQTKVFIVLQIMLVNIMMTL